MPNDYSMHGASRKKAKSLNAQDVNTVLGLSVTTVIAYLTQKQMAQMQKVLDAAVVNPVVKKEAEELERRSVTHRAGSLVMRDPRIERQADRALLGMIWVKEDDKHIRLDFEKLLTKDALEPQTDNPDEAAYLKSVRETLKKEGVWLRVDQERSSDPRSFTAWLSLGYGGDTIPASGGVIDREAILGTTLFGARHYDFVFEGPTRKTLESQIYRLDLEIEDGQKEHRRLIRRYDNALPGIAEAADALGGADLPSESIWTDPKALSKEAWDSFYADRFERAQVFLIAAAVATSDAVQKLSTYADKSVQGAALAAKIATVVAVASAVIVTVVDITGLARGLAARSAVAGETGEALAARVVNSYVGRNAENNHALLRMVGRLNGPKGSMAGGAKPGTSAGAGTGFTKWP